MSVGGIDIYGSQQIWNKHLNNCLQGIKVTEPDPTASIPDQDYRSILEQVCLDGFDHQLLTLDRVNSLCKQLIQKEFNNGSEVFSIIETARTKIGPRTPTPLIVEILADVLSQIEKLAVLGSSRHKITHLALNYLRTYCLQPLIEFSANEKAQYIAAIDSTLQARTMLADKIREFVIIQGEFFERCIHTPLTDRYKKPEEPVPELTIQWNELVKETIKWSKEDQSR